TLHETTRQDANWLMLVSIRQALAGPDQDTSIWLGRPVTDLVEQIYKEHVYNRNRGLVEQDLKSAAFFATVRELHAHEERRCGRRTRRNHADD
ncbi:MAG: hypothetical protein NT069_22400, partial [Planctomycetota bacterium]|nr:hypothetical protein [Planctomycetota bacterium]